MIVMRDFFMLMMLKMKYVIHVPYVIAKNVKEV